MSKNIRDFKKAVLTGNIPKMNELLGKHKEEIQQLINEKDNLLITASTRGDANTVEILLNIGFAVNKKNEDGDTALLIAAFNNNRDVLELLLEYGADINTKNNAGETPLIKAAYTGNMSILKRLLLKGVDVNAKDEDGNTALIIAASENEKPDGVYLLITAGADVNATDNNGMNALAIARERVRKNPKMVHMLENAHAYMGIQALKPHVGNALYGDESVKDLFEFAKGKGKKKSKKSKKSKKIRELKDRTRSRKNFLTYI
jgi:ankyrin repeat protein